MMFETNNNKHDILINIFLIFFHKWSNNQYFP